MGWLLLPLSYVWGFFVTVLFFSYTIFVSFILMFALLVIKSRKFQDWYISTVWGRGSLWLCNIKLVVIGKENIPKDSGGLFLFSHGSNLDIIALAAGLPAPRFGAKIELFRIPFLGAAMRGLGMLPIYRKKRAKVLGIYKEAEKRMRAGEFFALAPEGKRITENKIVKLKNGPFQFVVGARSIAIPVVIDGAREAMPNGSMFINPGKFSGKITIKILPTVDMSNYTEEDIPEIKEQVWQIMSQAFTTLHSHNPSPPTR